MSSHLFFYKSIWAFLLLTSDVSNQPEFIQRVDLGKSLLTENKEINPTDYLSIFQIRNPRKDGALVFFNGPFVIMEIIDAKRAEI